MRTIVIQIGNSDDKLTQRMWSSFVADVDAVVQASAAAIHFFGAPPNYTEWQNVAWIFVIEERSVEQLKREVACIRQNFLQDSVAWLEGEAVFI